MKRSSRHGWTLVQLAGDVLRVVATGDRDDLRVAYDELVRENRAAAPDLHCTGHGAAIYDGNGALRDCVPYVARLADGTRTRWPETVPADGAARAEVPGIHRARGPPTALGSTDPQDSRPITQTRKTGRDGSCSASRSRTRSRQTSRGTA